jgi:hypothetical protein
MRKFPIGALLSGAFLTLLAGPDSGRAQTWIQWPSADGGNNHYYALTSTAADWNVAQKLAVSWGGTLATINSSNEQNFINTTFLTGKFEHLPLWIGLFKPPTKGPFSGKVGSLEVQVRLDPKEDFQWVTGEPFSYTNWKSGEPSDTPPGENYVAINWEFSDVPPRGIKGDWNDTPLNGTAGYGGKTDGPYFGLVERDTDPTRAARTYPVYPGLMAALAAVFIFCFVRLKKHRADM